MHHRPSNGDPFRFILPLAVGLPVRVSLTVCAGVPGRPMFATSEDGRTGRLEASVSQHVLLWYLERGTVPRSLGTAV